MADITPTQVLDAYVAIRDQRNDVVARHKEELAPYTEKIDKLGAWLQRELLTSGLQNFSNKEFVAFLKTNVSVKVEDWESTLNYIRTNKAYDLLERRVSKAAVEDYEKSGETIPGIKYNKVQTVHVNRK